ncbi:hypothetical protein [Vibrio harveyi]|uniref:hypothetical protein n=1 Tax=Vibrio harveyi TaxID=669 RepID=UPI003909B671
MTNTLITSEEVELLDWYLTIEVSTDRTKKPKAIAILRTLAKLEMEPRELIKEMVLAGLPTYLATDVADRVAQIQIDTMNLESATSIGGVSVEDSFQTKLAKFLETVER